MILLIIELKNSNFVMLLIMKQQNSKFLTLPLIFGAKVFTVSNIVVNYDA